MKKIKKTVAALLATAIGITGFAAFALESGTELSAKPEKEYAQRFSDVDENYWAFEYIAEMAEREILSGYPDGSFLPEDHISRAEFARIIAGASGLEVRMPEEMSFADVKPDDWYAAYVETAKYFLNGYSIAGETVFAPNSKALREDIAVALVKLKGYDVSDADTSILDEKFVDGEGISEYAKKYIAVAIERELVSGYPDGTFRPQNTITRAEAAAMLWRACQYGNDNKTELPEVSASPEPEIKPEPTVTPLPEKTPEPTVTPSFTPAPTVSPVPTPTTSATPDGFVEQIPHSFETSLAIVQKSAYAYTSADGDDVDNVTVLYKGKSGQALLFKPGIYKEAGLGVGDVFFFGTDRYGYVDEIFIIYDYSEDDFKHLISSNWSCNLWDEGDDYQLAEGYIVEMTRSYIMLAPRAAVEAGRIDTGIEANDDHENGVGVFAYDEDGFAYEFDAYNENIYKVADRFRAKRLSSLKTSNFDKFETSDGIYEGELLTEANYAVAIIEDGEIKEIYSIVK